MPEAVQSVIARTSPPAVDADILSRIESPVAPVGIPGRVVPPDTLPGKLGAVAALKAMVGTFWHGVDYEERMRARYGEVYRTMYMAEPMVAVTHPDELHKILRNEQSTWSTAMAWEYLFFDGLNVEGGNPGSLLTLDFDLHRTARKLVQPAFSTAAIAGYVDIAQASLERSVARWVAQGGVHLKPTLHTLWPSISNQLLTGIEDPAVLRGFDRALRAISSGAQALVRTRLLNPFFHRARSAYGALTRYFAARVQERRERPGKDLFSRLCQVGDGPEELPAQAIVRMFLTMMLGAHDSTSLGITSTAYLLAKHPDWQRRVREEADAAGTGRLDAKGLQGLAQLDLVWRESLRLMPATDFVPRRALHDVEVAGHRLKAGTLVGALTGCVGRHPDWWSHPTRFDPERFSAERAEHKRHPAIYAPFGGGAHVCVGMQLATLEAKVFFHTLLTRCRFELQRDYDAGHAFRPLGSASGKVTLKLIPR